MTILFAEARLLGFHLGLGDLQDHERCHGYANACMCSQCLERVKNPVPAEEPVRQPWDARKAA